MRDKKRKVAAISAVIKYIKTYEEAAALMQASIPPVPEVGLEALPAYDVKLWGISGRQSMMQMRNLLQLRTFQGSKLH